MDGAYGLSLMRWALPILGEGHEIGYKMINARAETGATKSAFRAAYMVDILVSRIVAPVSQKHNAVHVFTLLSECTASRLP